MVLRTGFLQNRGPPEKQSFDRQLQRVNRALNHRLEERFDHGSEKPPKIFSSDFGVIDYEKSKQELSFVLSAETIYVYYILAIVHYNYLYLLVI